MLSFEQIHIDVARNSTDDFNPFHDPQRWQEVQGNPFGAPIVLGFQMEFLAADRIARHRRDNGEDGRAVDKGLHFSNYEFLFTDALRAGEGFEVTVKNTVDRTAKGGGLSNRVVLRKDSGRPVLMGSQSATAEPRFLADATPSGLPQLERFPDRSRIPGSPFFLKRKFLNTSNGKNFALAALCDQHDYFDELTERVQFAPLFTASLLSCALLEKLWADHHDFAVDPLVYTSHQISVDHRVQDGLRSNDRVHILVDGPALLPPAKGLGGAAVEQYRFHCFGVLHGSQLLFRAILQLAPLHGFLGTD